MTFLNPPFLFGLLAISLPIAIHLLSKPPLQRMRWAASRFLLASVQKNQRRTQVEDVLLLLLRCLLVALLALIFARPAWLIHALGLDVAHGATTAVIVLDDSASMGQSDGVQSRFDQAKTMIDGILSKMERGSSCALFVVSDRAQALIPKPTKDFSIVHRTLAEAPLTDGGSNLFPGVRAAVDVLKSSDNSARDIYVLTDSQIAAWREAAAIRQLQQDNAKIAMHFIVVGDHGEDNLGVTGLQLSGTLLAINQPIACTVEVSNWSRSKVAMLPVKLSVDNEPPLDEKLLQQIDPGTAKSIVLMARFREPGYHSITATIPGDRLPADNQRSLALRVLDEIRVLVVEGTQNPDPAARDGFFLQHALQPVRPDQLASYPLKVTMGALGDLESSTLNQYQLVFLSNVSQLTPVGAHSLRQYVSQGGSLVVFPGPATDTVYYNTDPNFSALLPAALGKAADPPGDRKILGWQSKDYEHPITTLWNDPSSGNLAAVEVTHYFPLTIKTPPGADPSPAHIVVKYADSEPAVVEQTMEKGKVFLFSSTATTTWTNLPLQPAFVPLLIRLTAYVTGLGGKLNLAPGEPFTAEVDSADANQEFSVERPGEKKRPAGRIEQGDPAPSLSYSHTEQAGVYRVYVAGETKPKAVFAVQIDPSESNLIQETQAHLEPLMKSAPSVAADASAAAASEGKLVPGPELWYALAVTALGLVILETFLAHFFSQSK